MYKIFNKKIFSIISASSIILVASILISNNLASQDGCSDTYSDTFPLLMTEEPDKHRQAREQIRVYSESWGGGYLEYYLVRIMPGWLKNGLDQLTCMYFLIFPGKEWEGDVEGILEIYNQEKDKWSKPETIKKMVCEYTRLTWAGQQIRLTDGRTFKMSEVKEDEKVTEGYVTFRVDVE